MAAKFSLAMIALTVLCTCTLAQENTLGYWLNKGNESFANRSYQEAVDAYTKATQIDPQNIQAWQKKGYALDNIALTVYGINDSKNFVNTLEKSVQAFNNAIEINPQNAEAWADKGFSLGLMGPLNNSKYDESIQAYERALTLEPNYAEAWQGKGEVLRRWSNSLNAEADAAFAKANELGYQD